VELRNYEINRVLRQVIEQPGKVKRLSLAVVVDGVYKGKANAFTPRSPEELRQFANLAKKAVGFTADRGDQLEISCVPIASPAHEGSSAVSSSAWQESFWPSLKIGIVVLMLLMVLMVVLRKRRAPQEPPLLAGPPGSALPPPAPAEVAFSTTPSPTLPLSAAAPHLALPDAIDGRDRVAHLVSAYPDRAVEVLRLWLHDRDIR
jgi:flagellar M-ring protein FliF